MRKKHVRVIMEKENFIRDAKKECDHFCGAGKIYIPIEHVRDTKKKSRKLSR